jgi:hypothetical protein
MFEVFVVAVQNTKEVDKDCFPNAEFELVHEIDNEHQVQDKTEL